MTYDIMKGATHLHHEPSGLQVDELTPWHCKIKTENVLIHHSRLYNEDFTEPSPPLGCLVQGEPCVTVAGVLKAENKVVTVNVTAAPLQLCR